MIENKRNIWMGLFLATIFLLIQMLFQLQMFTPIFMILILLMISVAFLSETNRVFVWTIVSFSGGLFAFIYADRLLLLLPFSHANLILLNRLLLLFPILIIGYVLYKFKATFSDFRIKMDWGSIKLRGNREISIKRLYIMGLVLLLLVFLFSFIESFPVKWIGLWRAVAFSALNAALVEVLFRGVLLTRFITVIDKIPAVFFTSLSGAIAYYLFGYSFSYSFLFFVIGLLLGLLTIHTKSLLPAITGNFLLSMIFTFMNVIPFYYQY